GIRALISKLTAKEVDERKNAAILLKSLGPGNYPESLIGSVCSAVAAERSDDPRKAMLEALAVVDPDLAPSVVTLIMVAPVQEGSADLFPWKTAVADILRLKRSTAAPVIRQRLKTLLTYLTREEVAALALEMIKSLAELSPEEASAKVIGDALS